MKTTIVLHEHHTISYLTEQISFWNRQIGYWLTAVRYWKRENNTILFETAQRHLGYSMIEATRFRKLLKLRQAADMASDLKKWSDSKV